MCGILDIIDFNFIGVEVVVFKCCYVCSVFTSIAFDFLVECASFVEVGVGGGLWVCWFVE